MKFLKSNNKPSDIPEIRHALSDLEAEIMWLQELADISRTLEAPSAYVNRSVVLHADAIRAAFNRVWDAV